MVSLAFQVLLCGLCIEPVALEDKAQCISPKCQSVSHLVCLAEHFRKTSSQKSPSMFLPGLVINSILFCWPFTSSRIRMNKKGFFYKNTIKVLLQIFLTVSTASLKFKKAKLRAPQRSFLADTASFKGP